ncbi:MAG: hypothetical protein LAP61_18630 [Acidobacteriia bacterium]|nr:hypothetical protein [Terriglobia bacterium]
MKTAVFLLVSLASGLSAQPLRVYSEFAKIDATGRVTAPAEPREILSPAIARNAFSSFQVVVDVPRGTPYQLYIAQNPENAVAVTLYRESGDKLERVEQPVSGNTTQVFWMDLWTARDAPVVRIKVEPQLHVNNDWVIYPMEARVMEATVSDGMKPSVTINQLSCAGFTPSASPDVGRMNLRNAQQDAALASVAPQEDIRKLGVGTCDAPVSHDPEWYLRVRDYLLRPH